MTTVLLLCLAILVRCQAAPTTYDQRQDGMYNIHGKLENFLILVATSGTHNLLDDLVTQVTELKGLTSRHNSAKKAVESVVKYETEDDSKEPYKVEIIRIGKDEDDESHESTNENLKTVEEDPLKTIEFNPEGKESDRKAKSLLSHADDHEVKTQEIPSVLKASKDKDKIQESKGSNTLVPEISKNSQKEMKEFKNVWSTDTGRPGTSLKKELSRKQEQEAILAPSEKNDVEISAKKPQELFLDSRKISRPVGNLAV